MKTYSFKFYVGKEHLSPLAQKYGGPVYISVSYECLIKPIIYYYGATDVAHRNIVWSDKLYEEIYQATLNNYQSMYQSKPEYN